MKREKTASKRALTGRSFDALPEAQKQKIIARIESKMPREHLAESRPLNSRERAQWEDLKRHGTASRPKLGRNGVKVISLSVERDLLDRADAYAKKHGLKRAEFFTAALRGALD